MTNRALWTLLLALVALPVAAQETKPEDDPAAPETERTEPAKHIQVLKDPHDISKYYRSSQGEQPFEVTSQPSTGGKPFDPYSIASYYRSSASGPGAYGYS